MAEDDNQPIPLHLDFPLSDGDMFNLLAEAAWDDFCGRHQDIVQRFRTEVPERFELLSTVFKLGFVDGVLAHVKVESREGED